MRVRRAAAAVPSDFHPVLARMFAEVAGSNGKGARGRARETSKGKTAGGCVHPTFVCEAENESRLKEGTQRSERNFTTSVAATAESDGATLMRSFPNAFFRKRSPHFHGLIVEDGRRSFLIFKFIGVQFPQGPRLHFATY